MPVITVDELPDLIGPDQTIAGLDLGSKTIGVAISDRSLKFAHPRQVVRRKKFTADAQKLQDCFRSDDVVAVVIGLPTEHGWKRKPAFAGSQGFCQKLRAALANTICLVGRTAIDGGR